MYANNLIAVEQTVAHWIVASASDEITKAVLALIVLFGGLAWLIRVAAQQHKASAKLHAENREMVQTSQELSQEIIQINHELIRLQTDTNRLLAVLNDRLQHLDH